MGGLEGGGKTWSGKGKRPQWFDAGRTEDFLIAA